ncbi:MAG: hypothetical protein WBO38_00445 [Chitinophagaceae bacterium]
MKRIVTVFMLVSLLAACDNSEKKEPATTNEELKPAGEVKTEITPAADAGPANRLEGSWVIKRAEGNMASMNEGTVYEFKGDKLSLGKDGFNNPGSTEITDKTFSFQAEGNSYKFMYDYHFNGDTLVTSMQNSKQTFYMVKQ